MLDPPGAAYPDTDQVKKKKRNQTQDAPPGCCVMKHHGVVGSDLMGVAAHGGVPDETPSGRLPLVTEEVSAENQDPKGILENKGPPDGTARELSGGMPPRYPNTDDHGKDNGQLYIESMSMQAARQQPQASPSLPQQPKRTAEDSRSPRVAETSKTPNTSVPGSSDDHATAPAGACPPALQGG